MSPKISIILPTYNRSYMIHRMVDALLNQTFSDFELIIVNDGSKDNTSEVLEEYRQRDSRIKVINKTNGGLSSARNAGIEVANSPFITFVDDDDIVVPDYIESMLKDELKEFDLVIDSYSNQLDDNIPVRVHFPETHLSSRLESLKYIFGDLQTVPYCFFAHAKRFRTEIIRKYNVRFSTRIKFVEDRPFILDYLRHCSNMVVIDTCGYIVKTTTEANYRLSQGNKPAEYLCYNIRESFVFLRNYADEMQINLIREYADKYLVDKIYTYLLIPLAQGRHKKTDLKIIQETFNPILKEYKPILKPHRFKMVFIWLFYYFKASLAVRLLQFRLKTGNIIRKFVS